MSKVVKIQDGDYKVITGYAGTITLDTGNKVGRVVITGSLDVVGTTTTIESVSATIKDNTIVLNQGETGYGVTLGTAGIAIDRGQSVGVNLLYDESILWSTPGGQSRTGAWTLRNNQGELTALQVNSLTTGSGSLRINTGTTGTGTISVAGVPDYENRVTDDDDIPNLKFLTNYILSNYTPGGGQGQAVVDQFYRYNGYNKQDTGGQAYDTGAGDGTSRIEFKVDGTVKTIINSTGLIANDITSNTGKLSITAANNEVDINAYMGLTDQASTPSSVLGKNLVYSSATQSTGATGIYFTNSTTNGELISSKKALLYAIIF